MGTLPNRAINTKVFCFIHLLSYILVIHDIIIYNQSNSHIF